MRQRTLDVGGDWVTWTKLFVCMFSMAVFCRLISLAFLHYEIINGSYEALTYSYLSFLIANVVRISCSDHHFPHSDGNFGIIRRLRGLFFYIGSAFSDGEVTLRDVVLHKTWEYVILNNLLIVILPVITPLSSVFPAHHLDPDNEWCILSVVGAKNLFIDICYFTLNLHSIRCI
jgi:hypothetical protein